MKHTLFYTFNAKNKVFSDKKNFKETFTCFFMTERALVIDRISFRFSQKSRPFASTRDGLRSNYFSCPSSGSSFPRSSGFDLGCEIFKVSLFLGWVFSLVLPDETLFLARHLRSRHSSSFHRRLGRVKRGSQKCENPFAQTPQNIRTESAVEQRQNQRN